MSLLWLFNFTHLLLPPRYIEHAHFFLLEKALRDFFDLRQNLRLEKLAVYFTSDSQVSNLKAFLVSEARTVGEC